MEYVLIIGLVALVIVVGLTAFGGKVKSFFQHAGTVVTDAKHPGK